jgi:flagellar biosynthesis/type III secretory pathway M-ring protein FliF/YscJ
VRFEGKAHFVDKVSVLRKALFPPRAEMAWKYPAPADSWRVLCYYPVRFMVLWMRYRQAMWRLLRRDRKLITEARREAHLRDYLGWD